MVRTTLAINGAPELILAKAVELGLARSKSDAIRLGIFSLNKEYGIVKDIESELVARKIIKEKAEMKARGERYLTEEEALQPYKHLLKKK
jgi:hypothetical protein